MAGSKSLVTVLGALCFVTSRVGAQEATTMVPSSVASVISSNETAPIAGQPVVPDGNEKPQEAPKKEEPIATTLPDSKPGAQESVTKPTTQQEKKPEVNPATPEKQPEAATEPPKQNPKTNAQEGGKGKDSKGSAATLYTNCGLFVLFGAILLRL